MALEPYKADFLRAALSGNALRFGTFSLKSGRQSPYFFNAGDFYRADLLEALAVAYAKTIHTSNVSFDVIFGPAYKGIPLATAATLALRPLDPERYNKIEYSFDRKEAKDHGEGGTIVGAPLKGRKVLVVDDVVSAGTAKREAIAKIRAQGGEVVGIVVAVDRQETLPDREGSAIGELRKEFGIPIIAILTLEDIIAGARDGFATEDDLKRIQEYKAKYGASD
ncbi:orotate phosphoribosyltransferase-like protein [Pseudomassariella vexata]|uniref:Orotate phosphoribosyltransferase n=1 Tax=Pseudomassariella vexata TaxID=1141098 RepID=A0A1Y2DV48_9PEZI|nr:orotate phosphoribosyltransferase-like protein [Pseudomassariella vexata]ORY63143.1 orotate phosphoribosyltransferase-like protein [Pseudomassariella vexata]